MIPVPLPKTQKCKYCDAQATKRIIHAEGRAYIPTCDEHLKKGKQAAARVTPSGTPDPSNIDRVDDIKAIDTDPDPSPNPGARRLRKYWTRGPGAAKIGWGTHGDFDRCVTHLRKYVGPSAEGLCNVFHQSATGAPPGKGHKVQVLDGILTKMREADGGPVKPAAKKPVAKTSTAKKKVPAKATASVAAKKKKKTTAGSGGSGAFNSAHPRNPDGTFKYKNDTGKGDVGRGTKDKTAAADGKVHGRIGRLQANLVKLGLLKATDGEKGQAVDGKFGAKTEAATRAFQKKNGLKVTGKLDSATEKKMNDTMLARKKTTPAKKTAAPAKKATTAKKSLFSIGDDGQLLVHFG